MSIFMLELNTSLQQYFTIRTARLKVILMFTLSNIMGSNLSTPVQAITLLPIVPTAKISARVVSGYFQL